MKEINTPVVARKERMLPVRVTDATAASKAIVNPHAVDVG